MLLVLLEIGLVLPHRFRKKVNFKKRRIFRRNCEKKLPCKNVVSPNHGKKSTSKNVALNCDKKCNVFRS